MTEEVIEFTRRGFSYLGRAMEMLANRHRDALVILALTKGETTFRDIANILSINDIELTRCLQRLILEKCVTSRVLHKRNLYSLTETGKRLAEAWSAFVKSGISVGILPKEERDRIKEVLKEE